MELGRDALRLWVRERNLWNASRLNGAPHPWFGTMGFKVRVNWLSSHNTPLMTIRQDEKRVEFRLIRGFVGSVKSSARVWIRQAAGILAAHPVHEVTWTTLPPFFYQTDDGEWVDTQGETWGGSDHAANCQIIEAKCKDRWKSVRVWNMPPEPVRDQGWQRYVEFVLTTFQLDAATYGAMGAGAALSQPVLPSLRRGTAGTVAISGQSVGVGSWEFAESSQAPDAGI